MARVDQVTVLHQVHPRSSGGAGVASPIRRHARPSALPRGRHSSLLGLIFTAVAAASWLFVLRPQSFGGPAAYIAVSGKSMDPVLQPGDLALLRRADIYRVGDVVAYTVPPGEPASGRIVIHRIIGGSGPSGFIVEGDNTDGRDVWLPRSEDIVGRLWLTIPSGGRILMLARSPLILAASAAGFTVFILLGAEPKAGCRTDPRGIGAPQWRSCPDGIEGHRAPNGSPHGPVRTFVAGPRRKGRWWTSGRPAN
jgi:signal peptidase I